MPSLNHLHPLAFLHHLPCSKSAVSGLNLVTAFEIFFMRQQKILILICQMQNIEQFVKERQEIKPLQTCESDFFDFSIQQKYAVSQL